jgi:hypothetical protein
MDSIDPEVIIMNITGFSWVIMLVCIAAFACNADVSGATYRNDLYHFTMTLPGDWRQVPDNVLTAASEYMSKGTNTALDYLAGFQVGPSEQWFQYPYVLVQYDSSGTVTEKSYLEFARRNFGDIDVKSLIYGSRADSLLASAGTNTPVWDSLNHLLWVPMSATLADGRPLTGLTVFKLHRKGFIGLSYYDSGTRLTSEMQQILLPVMKAVTFDPGFEYNEAAARDAENHIPKILRGVKGGAIRGALIGAAIGVVWFYLVQRRRRAAAA